MPDFTAKRTGKAEKASHPGQNRHSGTGEAEGRATQVRRDTICTWEWGNPTRQGQETAKRTGTPGNPTHQGQETAKRTGEAAGAGLSSAKGIT